VVFSVRKWLFDILFQFLLEIMGTKMFSKKVMDNSYSTVQRGIDVMANGCVLREE